MALSLFKKYTAAKTIILVLLTMVFTSPAFAQVGLPIVSMVEDGSGGEKYSLTLQPNLNRKPNPSRRKLNLAPWGGCSLKVCMCVCALLSPLL